MTIHHMITQDQQIHSCIYCKVPVENLKWQSEFESTIHYKTSICTCGKRLSIKVSFQGSGHDEWTIENKIKQELNKIRHTTS